MLQEDLLELLKSLNILADVINLKFRSENEKYHNLSQLDMICNKVERVDYLIRKPQHNYKMNIYDELTNLELETAKLLMLLLDFSYQNQLNLMGAISALYNEKSNSH